MEPTVEHLQVLRKYFGHSNFRPLQWSIIYSLIEEKRDACVIMATGYGKSLCYQYPAVYCQGLSIVVSPLISLMHDQVLSLQMSNICACFFGSSQTDKARTLSDVFSGACRVLYVTPEWCTSEYGLETLKKLHASRSITLLAVDEAHCVSQWGIDFRPTFRRLESVRKVLTNVPVLAVTATATPQVRIDICRSLRLRQPKVIITSFNRPNLYFSVLLKCGTKPEQVYRNFTAVMESHGLGHKFSGPTLIYCPTKNKTEEIADILRDHGIECGIYHAGLCASRRKQVHEDFLSDRLNIVVATVAFGMGIDKPNVRCVIHYGAPRDIESYYQEIGRAGRDGLPSTCHVFYSDGDFALNNFMTSSSYKENDKFQEHKRLMARRMRTFLETGQCRRRLLLSYFDDSTVGDDKTAKPNCCDNCDRLLKKGVSVEPQSTVNVTEELKLLLRVFRLFNGRFGLNVPIKFLRGTRDAKVPVDKMSDELFGAGKDTSEAAWKALSKLCLRENLLKEKAIPSSFRGHKNFSRFLSATIEITPEGINYINRGDLDNISFEMTPNEEMLFKRKKLPVVISQNKENRANSWKDNLLQYRNDKSLKKEKEQQAFLYRELIKLRDDLAFTHSCAPHMIIENNSLFLVALNPPSDKAELANVKGFTEAKIEKFGDAFLNKVLEFFGKKEDTSSPATDDNVVEQNDDFLYMMNAEYLNKNAVDYTTLDSTSKEYVLTEEELASFDNEMMPVTGPNVVDEVLSDEELAAFDNEMLPPVAKPSFEVGRSQPVAETSRNDDMWGDEQDDIFDDLPLEQLEGLVSPTQTKGTDTSSDRQDVISRDAFQSAKATVPLRASSSTLMNNERREARTEYHVPRTESSSADHGSREAKYESSCTAVIRKEMKAVDDVPCCTREPIRPSTPLKVTLQYEDDSEEEEKELEPNREPESFKKRTLPAWLMQSDAKEKIQKRMKGNSLFKS